MEIREDEYLQSMLNIKSFEVASVLKELGKPIKMNQSLSWVHSCCFFCFFIFTIASFVDDNIKHFSSSGPWRTR